MYQLREMLDHLAQNPGETFLFSENLLLVGLPDNQVKCIFGNFSDPKEVYNDERVQRLLQDA